MVSSVVKTSDAIPSQAAELIAHYFKVGTKLRTDLLERNFQFARSVTLRSNMNGSTVIIVIYIK